MLCSCCEKARITGGSGCSHAKRCEAGRAGLTDRGYLLIAFVRAGTYIYRTGQAAATRGCNITACHHWEYTLWSVQVAPDTLPSPMVSSQLALEKGSWGWSECGQANRLGVHGLVPGKGHPWFLQHAP